MIIRSNPIYLSSEVWDWLRLIAKSESEAMEFGPKVTPDEIADQILRQAIREQHPKLPEYQKQIEALRKAVIQALQKGKIENETPAN